MSLVIIGAGGLIGNELSRHFSSRVESLYLLDKYPENINFNDLCIDCDTKNIKIDINNESELNNFVEELKISEGGIEGVINCSYPKSLNYGKHLHDVSLDDFNEVLNLHLGGYFNVLNTFSKHLFKNYDTSFISFSSIYGTIAPDFSLYKDLEMTMPVQYAAIKAGINNLVRYFAKYYKKTALRFNTISPGGILNNQNKDFVLKYNQKSGIKGMLDPYDLVGLTEFLVSKHSKYINGQNFIIDDGFSL